MKNKKAPKKKITRKHLSVVARPWHGRATQHGQNGRAIWHSLAMPVLWLACVIFRPCTPVALPCLAFFALFVLFLVPRTSLYLYSSLESSPNATFSNKTRRFFLKAQKSRNISKTASKEANTSLSHLD